MSKKHPLTVSIEKDELVIRIGVATLKFAVEAGPRFEEEEDAPKIIDAAVFAKDVLHELLDEDEEGSTRVHALLDDAAWAAVENGSEGVAES